MIEIQGHRGCRGLLPENTLPAFEKALDLGVHTLELDVCVTGNGKIIVSHEPWMSAEICSHAEREIGEDNQMEGFNIFQMTSDEIRSFDCGSNVHPRFPDQEKMRVHKPLLTEVIELADNWVRNHPNDTLLPKFNIELKSRPEWDDQFHPIPTVFVAMVMDIVMRKGIAAQTNIQSFDLRILKEMRKQFPDMSLALLIENEKSPEENLDELGFIPEIYSPYYKLVDDDLVQLCKEKGMRLIPWTVNEVSDMERLVNMGVDGLITDYPDRAVGRFN